MEIRAVREALFALQDEKHREFQIKLIPNIPPDTIIGVRTPALRELAKKLALQQDTEGFLTTLPHGFFEENNLHGFIISLCRDYDRTIGYLDAFLPYVDNWATCDQMRPKILKKHPDRLIRDIDRWLDSGEEYAVRFGIEMLMTYFLDDPFRPEYHDKVARIRDERYYVRMMIAWYFATALAKQWTDTLPYLTEKRLSPWVHNKTIQKATESYRITPEQKKLLRGMRR